jgi:hypothetical protein
MEMSRHSRVVDRTRPLDPALFYSQASPNSPSASALASYRSVRLPSVWCPEAYSTDSRVNRYMARRVQYIQLYRFDRINDFD